MDDGLLMHPPRRACRQSLVARRQQAHWYGAATSVDFEPEHFQQMAGLNFTGAFVGMACHDVSGAARCADFDYFEYRERAYLERPL